jgi:hypothetical protein
MLIGGGHCNRLQWKVMVNRDFVKTVVLHASINQIIKWKTTSPSRPGVEPIHRCTCRSRATAGERPCRRAREEGRPIWCGGGASAAPVPDPPLATEIHKEEEEERELLL